MAATRVLAKGFNFWPDQGPKLNSVADIVDAYENKHLAGAYFEPETKERLLAYNHGLTGFSQFEDAAVASGFADESAGQLVIPFVHILEAYPGSLPGGGQERGDCVSWSQRNAGLGTMVCEVAAGLPDQQTGLAEECPQVSQEGIKNGVLSTEAIYWWRRHSGHGWYCGSASLVTQKESGLWVRQDYPELGINLTKYSGNQTELYGKKPPTGKIAGEGKQHLIRAFAEVTTKQGRRDALANGYFLSTCGSESFSNQRDANGVSERTRAGWAHAMAVLAFDDRKIVYDRYGDSLELYQNSWAIWNGGSRDILDSAKYVPPAKKAEWIAKDIVNPATGNIMIPKGSFWAKSRDVAKREVFAMSSVNGWPKQKLDFLLRSPLG